VEIYIAEAIAHKLEEKHHVQEQEVIECFDNRTTKYAYDTRKEHQTDPPTLWFIGQTNAGRRLKVVFVRYNKIQHVIKSAYEPNIAE
jgi:hypothetical protein